MIIRVSLESHQRYLWTNQELSMISSASSLDLRKLLQEFLLRKLLLENPSRIWCARICVFFGSSRTPPPRTPPEFGVLAFLGLPVGNSFSPDIREFLFRELLENSVCSHLCFLWISENTSSENSPSENSSAENPSWSQCARICVFSASPIIPREYDVFTFVFSTLVSALDLRELLLREFFLREFLENSVYSHSCLPWTSDNSVYSNNAFTGTPKIRRVPRSSSSVFLSWVPEL